MEMRKYSVSVAMAAYNGEKYIKEQIESILCQLEERDELVISLDPSTDSTESIISSFSDSRIHVVKGLGLGVKKNFENAFRHCSNDIIFLCDQDDIWMKDKIDKVVSSFSEDCYVVLHDCSVVDNDMNILDSSFFNLKNTDTGIFHNLVKNGYIGCCMAFRRELLDLILPIPEYIYMHDQFIGMAGELMGKNKLIHERLIYYRRHGDNVSDMQHGSISTMVRKRWNMVKALLELKKRRKKLL